MNSFFKIKDNIEGIVLLDISLSGDNN